MFHQNIFFLFLSDIAVLVLWTPAQFHVVHNTSMSINVKLISGHFFTLYRTVLPLKYFDLKGHWIIRNAYSVKKVTKYERNVYYGHVLYLKSNVIRTTDQHLQTLYGSSVSWGIAHAGNHSRVTLCSSLTIYTFPYWTDFGDDIRAFHFQTKLFG
jgi:hypothetical protein